MKYQLKDYPEFRQKVKEMTVTELLHVVLCPNIVDDSDSWLLQDSVALFFHIASDEVLKGRIAAAKANSTLPKLIITDVEQGAGFLEHGTKFPSMRACGEAGDEQLAYEMGKISALETRALGFNWGLGPCVDIVANADNPIVGNRAPGKDLETVARIGKAVIAGMQENGLIAVAKHFPGDGYCTFDQHLTTAVNPLSEAEWRSTFGKLYRELIDAGVRSIMPGHISLPSMDQPDPETGICRPATLSHYLMTTLLKEELGFEGIIISDAVNMGGFCGYMERYRAYAEFLEAGGDLLLFAKATEECLNGMMQQVTNGTLRRETLEDRAYRVLCFAKEHERENETLAYDPVEHQRIADLIAQKGMKIGRDRYGVLPFKKSTDLRILYTNQNRSDIHWTAAATGCRPAAFRPWSHEAYGIRCTRL